MKILQKTGIFFLAVIAVLMILSIYIPSEVKISRSLVINAPREEIFNQVNDMRNWENWSPWHSSDPDLKLKYTGPSEGKGAGYSWESEKRSVGKGRLTVKESEAFNKITTEMQFDDRGTAIGVFEFDEMENGIKVTWTLNSDMGASPFNKYLGLFIDKWVGSDFEKGLGNLQKQTEGTETN